MADEFKIDAKDGDGDGFVQDGTEWERPVDEVIVTPKKKSTKKTAKKIAEPVATEDETVALWSEANLHQLSWGPLLKGPNIVSKEVAEKWLTHRSVRLATPEEVAAYYNGQ